MQEHTIGGVDIHYYSLCKRKLWLYNKDIGMEDQSDRVLQGKILHETSYPRIKQKEILIDNAFVLDAIEGDYVREIKLTSKMQESDTLQMLFYLYQLAQRGLKKKGLISYTKEKKTIEVELTDDKAIEIKRIIEDVYNVINQPKPPPVINLRYCKSCAYYEFCYVGEVDDHEA